MKITVNAYAKINLHLDVTAKRSDGYHNVENVMQSVSLCDYVTAELNDTGVITLECDVATVPTGEGNIAYRAAALFFECVGKECGAHIKIEKHIPMAAGLAGGSTDAAATLVALNRLCGKPMCEGELCELGAQLGADVPFCITGGAAYSDGRGDILHPFPSLPDNAVLLVACGGEGVSTPWAYKLLDTDNNDFEGYIPRGTDKLQDSLESDTPERFAEHIFNLFEASVLPLRPVGAKLKEAMQKGGAVAAMMSGSGPSVYGVFSDTATAERVRDEIIALGAAAFVCTSVAKQEI